MHKTRDNHNGVSTTRTLSNGGRSSVAGTVTGMESVALHLAFVFPLMVLRGS